MSRIKWTCPSCFRTFKVFPGNEPEKCPDCASIADEDIDVDPDAPVLKRQSFGKPKRITPIPTAKQRRPQYAMLGITSVLCWLGVLAFGAGAALFGMASQEKPQYIGTAIVCGMTALSCLFYAQLCAWALEVIDLLRKIIDRESTD